MKREPYKNLTILIFALLIFLHCIAITQSSFAQDCKTQAANKPSTLARGTDAIATGTGKMNAAEMAKMKPYLAKAESWTKNILTDFTGAKLLYYNNFFPKYLPDSETTDPMFITAGIRDNYQSQVMFFAYYCYENKYPLETEGESGSSVYVNFNNVFASGFTEDVGVYKVDGRSAFKIIKKNRTEGRIDFYELRGRNNATAVMYTSNDFIVLRNSDKPVFIPVTRKEYLQQMLKDLEDYKKREITSAKLAYTPANEAANKASFDEQLKRIDNSKNYTKEQMAPYRRRFIETWETEKQKIDKRMSKLEAESSQATQVLLEYLQKPTEWLDRTVSDFYSGSYTKNGVLSYLERFDKIPVNGVGEIEEYTLTELVTINPAYFNKTLGSEVPQVIMVRLRNGSYAHMQKVAALVKKTGALAPLEAMLNSNKSSQTIGISLDNRYASSEIFARLTGTTHCRFCSQ